MRAIRYGATAVDVRADAVLDLLNGGYLAIYDGPKPKTTDDEPTDENTLLAVLRFSQAAFKSSRNGVAEANPIDPEPSSRATGTPTWFRTYMFTDEPVMDGTVGPSDDGEKYDLTMDCAIINFDNEVRIPIFQYVEPR